MKKALIILTGFLLTFNSYAQICATSTLRFSTYFVDIVAEDYPFFGMTTVEYSDFRVIYNGTEYDWGSSFNPKSKITTGSASYQITLKATKMVVGFISQYGYTYNYTTETKELTITNNSQAVAALADLPTGIYYNTPPFELSGGTPAGGNYYGQGILEDNLTFSPAYGYTGTYSINYYVTKTEYGCTTSATAYKQITVLPVQTKSAITASDVCKNEGIIDLSTNTGTGGTFSGPGTNGTSFDPVVAGVGTHTISNSEVGYYDITFTITVLASPTVTLAALPTNKYVDDASFTLTGSPAGGTYSGTGVSGTTFDPAVAGAGTHTVTYSYTNGNNCTETASRSITVLPKNPDEEIPDKKFCIGSATITLSDGIPSGGTYRVNGAIATTFNPAIAGTYNITYDVAHYEQSSAVYTVNALPTVTLAAINPICASTASVNLNGKQFPATGGTFSGAGISGTTFYSNNSSYGTSGAGTYTVTYTYTDANTCTNSASRSIVVNALPTVTLDAFDDVCHNSGAVSLSGGLPIGGTYSGVEVSGTEFNPVTTGSHAITYTYTDGNGCTNSTNKNLVVNALPAVTLSDFSSMCENEAPLALSGGEPLGGTYSCTNKASAVSSGVFYPSVANIGTNNINYTYTDNNSCTNSASKGLMLLDAPNVSLTNPSDVCQNAPYIILSGGSPQGGTYYIDGVSMVGYTPADLSVGDHTLRYEYSLPNGCTDFAEQVLTILESPVVSLGTFDDICQNGEALSLSSGSPTGSGGEYYVNGANRTTFNPASYNVDDHTIKYEYTLANGCSDYEQQPITVLEAPVVSLGSFGAVCENEEPLTLNGGSPIGGTYSGTGVSGTTFNPASAGAGTHTITYTYTNGSGCTEMTSQNIVVYAVTAVSFTTLPRVCVNSSSFELTQGSPSGGVYNGTGVVNGYFYPNQADVGTHTITYTYTNENGCIESAAQTIIVDDITAITFPVLDGICENADILTLNTATPLGGEYGGTGVSGTMFYPTVAGVGSHSITYAYTNAEGCVSNSSRNITVFEKPNVTISDYDDLCGNIPEFELTGGLPLGGTYSGNGVADNKFTAKDAGVGTHVITYTYTNANGCSEIAETTITVLESAFVNLSPLDDICENAEPLNLSVTSSESGVYTGAGINNNKFYPALTGTGIFPITYTYTNANGCSDSDTENITVLTSPNVTLTTFVSICENDEPITLSGGSPAEGVYSGVGVLDGKFIPQIGAGTYTIRYTYDNGSCEDYAEQTITVFAAPEVDVKYLGDICHNAPEFTLSGGNPVGGTYYVDGIEKTKINPSSLTIGEHEVIYVYSAQNGCTVTAKTFMNILEAPEVSLSAFDDVCENTGLVTMSGGSPLGGTYSNDYIKDNNFYPELSGSGFHTITYTYTNGNGCTASAEKNINVLEAPIVTLPQFADVCQNGEAILLSGGLPVNGTYYFDDVIYALLNPINYAPSVHIVKYEYTNDKGCTASTEKALNILPSPIIYMPNITNICQNGNSIQLNHAYPTGGTYYVNESEKTLIDPSLYDAGNHSIKYTYTNNYGCSENESDIFSILPKPEVTLTIPNEICENAEALTLSGGLPEGGEYTGDGVISGIFYPSIGAGEYTIRYTVTNNDDCSDYAEKIITVNPAPEVTLERIDDVCQNAEAFTLSGGLPENGYYYIDDQRVTSFNPVNYEVNEYTVNYTYENENGCSSTATRNLNIIESSQLTISVFKPVCQNGEAFTLTGGLPEGGKYYINDVQVVTFDPQDYTPGIYTVTYKYGIETGCSEIVETTIEVLDIPVVPELDTESVYCPGQEFDLKVDNTEYTVNWFTEDMNELKADSENVTLKSDAPFTTYVQYKNDAGCVSHLTKLEINVETISLDIETIFNEVEQGTPVQFQSNVKTPGDVVEYYWQFSDGNISFERNPWYYCNLTGENDVSLEIITENGCTLSQTVEGIINVIPEVINDSDTEMITEGILLHIEEPADGRGKFENIYPNPASDRVYIQTISGETIKNSHDVIIQVLNLSGNVVMTHQEVLTENMKLDVSDLDTGMYIIQIIDLTTNQMISRQKIMKK